MHPIPKLDSVAEGQRIAFFGPMAVGKTYAANYLVQTYDYRRFSLASKLKNIAHELYGVTSKDGTGRKLYQELGDALRAFDDDVFIKYSLNHIHMLYPRGRIVIDDLRLPREAHLLRANGFKIVEVICDETVRLGRVQTLYPSVPEASRNHSTEVLFGEVRRDYSISSETEDQTIIELDNLIEHQWNKE